ncbi:MAG TPA: putative sulfate exporter family transporter [Acidimicrobiales bacterium]|nr:putative sulfate exporter family transporter [Acidimicrobiales bacterium]
MTSPTHLARVTRGPSSGGHRAPSTLSGARRRVTEVAPGLALAAAIAAVATAIGHALPVVGAPVVAVVAGAAVAVLRSPSERLTPGIAVASKKVLQASVVVLGSGLSLRQVLTVGAGSVPVLLGTLAVALVATVAAGRALGVRGATRTLIGVGTAICGASAIAAADAVIGADEADVSYAVATIFTFNVVAVLAYPPIGHALGLSQHAFGLWAGTAVNDVSSVVAAATVYGPSATSYAVIVKLTRTLAIVPICLALAARRDRRRDGAGGRLPLRRVVPTFVVVFVAAVCADSLHLVPGSWHRGLADAAAWMITAALAAIGLSTDLGRIRRAGLRPMALGAVAWAAVGLAGLALQALTGSR